MKNYIYFYLQTLRININDLKLDKYSNKNAERENLENFLLIQCGIKEYSWKKQRLDESYRRWLSIKRGTHIANRLNKFYYKTNTYIKEYKLVKASAYTTYFNFSVKFRNSK